MKSKKRSAAAATAMDDAGRENRDPTGGANANDSATLGGEECVAEVKAEEVARRKILRAATANEIIEILD